MPRQPLSYSNMIIYKIICDALPEFIYIGSTTNFANRKREHKSRCNNENSSYHHFKLYQTIRENNGWENWKMIEVERFTECKDGNDARKREQYFMDEFKSNLNMRKSMFSKEQWHQEHKEEKKEYHKQWHLKNKEEHNKKKREYRDQHKDEINQKRREKYAMKKLA